jgi:hypothetical protein
MDELTKHPLALTVLIFLLSMSFVQTAAIAQIDWASGLSTTLKYIFGGEIPDWMTNPYNVVSWVLLPFIAVAALMYGIMSEIQIFRTPGGKTAQKIIAIVAGLLGSWVSFYSMRVILAAASLWGTLAFGVLLVVGIFFWLRGGLNSQSYNATGAPMFKNDQLYKELHELRGAIRRGDDILAIGRISPAERKRIESQQEQMVKRLKEIEALLDKQGMG